MLETAFVVRYAEPVPVVSVTESQVVDAAGNLSDVYEITYTIEGQPGTFTLEVPKQGDPVAAAQAAIDRLKGEVAGIRAIG